MFLYPALLAPAYLGSDNGHNSEWGPYYAAAIVSLVFGLLISVQDKLDNPFNTFELPSERHAPLVCAILSLLAANSSTFYCQNSGDLRAKRSPFNIVLPNVSYLIRQLPVRPVYRGSENAYACMAASI